MSETPNHNPAQEEEPAQVPPQTPPQESQEAQPVQGAEGPQDPSLPFPLLLTTEVSASVKRQEALLRKSLLHQRIRTGLAVFLTCLIAVVLFQAIPLLNRFSGLVTSVQATAMQLQNTVYELNISQTMAGVDALIAESTTLVQDGTSLVGDSSKQLAQVMSRAQETLDSLSTVDFDGLNESIQTLEKITTAFGKLLGLS